MLIVFLVIAQVILLDGILSIDNIAALSSLAFKLPRKQRNKALRAGIIGAYVGRGVMLLLLGWLLQNPWTKLLASGYLLYLVGSHFFGWKKWEPEFKGVNTFWRTVIMIEIADLAFSIDNVAAVVALSSNIWLIIVGVCISIFFMRFAAQLFMKLIEWEPLLEHAAYILILAIALELAGSFVGIYITQVNQFLISLAIIIATMFIGQYKRLAGGENNE